MATPLTGVQGGMTITGSATQSSQLFKWTSNVPRDLHDVSSWDNANYGKEQIGGMHDLKGSVEGYVLASALPGLTQIQAGESQGDAGFVLQLKTGRTWTFQGLLSNIKVTVPKQGVATFSANFESSGEIVVL